MPRRHHPRTRDPRGLQRPGQQRNSRPEVRTKSGGKTGQTGYKELREQRNSICHRRGLLSGALRGSPQRELRRSRELPDLPRQGARDQRDQPDVPGTSGQFRKRRPALRRRLGKGRAHPSGSQTEGSATVPLSGGSNTARRILHRLQRLLRSSWRGREGRAETTSRGPWLCSRKPGPSGALRIGPRRPGHMPHHRDRPDRQRHLSRPLPRALPGIALAAAGRLPARRHPRGTWPIRRCISCELFHLRQQRSCRDDRQRNLCPQRAGK